MKETFEMEAERALFFLHSISEATRTNDPQQLTSVKTREAKTQRISNFHKTLRADRLRTLFLVFF